MLDFNNLDVLDPPDVEQTQFGSMMKLWLSNVIDICNANFTTLNTVVQYFENLITSQSAILGGTGTSYMITVIGLTPSGYVTATIISSINPASIVSIVPGLNSFIITFNTDPGAGSVIVYQAFIAQPQEVA